MKNKLYKKNVLNQKKNFKEFINFLVDSYYLNPKTELTIEFIKVNLKIIECPILIEFIAFLEKEKYITYIGTSKEKFIINYKGFMYLENLQKEHIKYENSLISIVISIGAFLIGSYSAISNKSVFEFIFTLIFTAIVCWGIKQIIDKKYY